jgi:hypothetical protein
VVLNFLKKVRNKVGKQKKDYFLNYVRKIFLFLKEIKMHAFLLFFPLIILIHKIKKVK